jgi:putative phosphoribosyl transferase
MFNDRDHAAGLLADAVEAAHPKDPVVLALPRGGVPVAVPVAERLGAPLDLLMVRKLGMPGQPELAAGAVVDGPAHEVVFNEGLLTASGLTEADFDGAITEQLAEIERRRRLYLGDHAPVDVTGRTAIVIDDGIATGATVKAALKALRKRDPAAIWLAVPVAPADTVPEFESLVDRLICLETPSPFWAVGAHYARFDQVSDEAVAAAMRAAWDKQTDTDKNE